MSLKIHELVGSPQVIVDLGNSQVNREFHVEGTTDHNIAIQYAIANIPATEEVNGLLLNTRKFTSVQNVGSKNDLWKIVCNYTYANYGGDLPTGQIEFLLKEPWDLAASFSVQMETEEVYRCLKNTPINQGSLSTPDVGT